jgi:hypothetical protein
MVKVIGVSVGADGAAWCSDSLGNLYRFDGTWKRDPSARAAEVAVGNGHVVWCRNNQGYAFKRQQGSGGSGTWNKDPQARMVRTISVGTDETVWVGNIYGHLFKRDGGEWKRNPSAVALEVAVGGMNHVWCRNADGHIFRLNSTGYNGSWTQDPVASMVTSIGVGFDGTVWVANSVGQLWKKEGNEWKRNPDGVAVQVSVGGANHVWCVNNAGQLFKLNGQAYNSSWTHVPGPKLPSWTYVVKEGDTLGEIVKAAFGLSGAALYEKVDEIAQLNGISDPDHIEAGQVIVLQY